MFKRNIQCHNFETFPFFSHIPQVPPGVRPHLSPTNAALEAASIPLNKIPVSSSDTWRTVGGCFLQKQPDCEGRSEILLWEGGGRDVQPGAWGVRGGALHHEGLHERRLCSHRLLQVWYWNQVSMLLCTRSFKHFWSRCPKPEPSEHIFMVYSSPPPAHMMGTAITTTRETTVQSALRYELRSGRTNVGDALSDPVTAYLRSRLMRKRSSWWRRTPSVSCLNATLIRW